MKRVRATSFSDSSFVNMCLPVFLHDSREHLDASVVQFLPLQVEGVDAQRRPAVVVHVQGDVRIEPAELAEALSELDHHDRIVLLDELLGEVRVKADLPPPVPAMTIPLRALTLFLPASQMSFLRGTWYILSCT